MCRITGSSKVCAQRIQEFFSDLAGILLPENMQESFSTLDSPKEFAFRHTSFDCNDKSSITSSPFVSAPSSPARIAPPGLSVSAPTSPYWAHQRTAKEDGYTRQDYASAIPFSWEEKPGTPKEASAREDASSFLISSGSDFEFSARFSELDDPPMSPIPMSTANGFFYNGQIWPLRPPPRLEKPIIFGQIWSENPLRPARSFELRSSADYGSPPSVPPSPRSPKKSPHRGLFKAALCGISSPVDQTFDPFVVAMEEISKPDSGSSQHRRTRSLSPLRIFHWDEHSSKSFSHEKSILSRDLCSEDKEQSEELPQLAQKSSKKWILKDFLRRMSGKDGNSNSKVSSRRSSSSSTEFSSCEKQSSEESRSSEGSQSATEGSPDAKTKNGKASRMKTAHRLTKGSVSPQEVHNYMMQRTQTGKKAFVHYKQGLFGCMGFRWRSYSSTISESLQPISG